MKYKILLVLALCAFFVAPIFADVEPITVNCANGQSLNGALSRLNKFGPTTVFVKGTCTEYVTINGFTGLTLIGLPGAALQQPSTTPSTGLGIYLLLIEASRSVTIDGFAVHSNSSALGAIAIGRNNAGWCSHVRILSTPLPIAATCCRTRLERYRRSAASFN